jgi:glycosyltransferase involved in cell wall biosynthesis
MNKISVVAPVYNEESNIPEFVQRVSANLELITKDYKIILVDDGSEDGSWKQIETEQAQNKNIVGIKLSKNFGHHNAITAGIHNTNSEWVVVMDSDLQDRPEVLPELFEKANEGFDVVFVSRTNRPETIWYMMLQKFFYFVLRLSSGIDFNSSQANYSIISKKVAESFKNFPEQARFYPSTINWLGYKRSEIKASHGTRFTGKASYTFRKRLKLATEIILTFSSRPLKFAIALGAFTSTISFILVLLIILKKLTLGFEILGWASTLASIFFIGGAILTVLGINGIYLDRIFSEVKARPLFIIDKRIEF